MNRRGFLLRMLAPVVSVAALTTRTAAQTAAPAAPDPAPVPPPRPEPRPLKSRPPARTRRMKSGLSRKASGARIPADKAEEQRPMKSLPTVLAGTLVLCLAAPGTLSVAVAAENPLNGAWILDGSQCNAIFTRTGDSFAFRRPIDAFAPAFIISGNRIRTPTTSCRIKASKMSGQRHIVTLACETSVSVDDVQASFELMPDGTLRRYLNAQDTIGSKYERCPSSTAR